jgi:hypothetical protein
LKPFILTRAVRINGSQVEVEIEVEVEVKVKNKL